MDLTEVTTSKVHGEPGGKKHATMEPEDPAKDPQSLVIPLQCKVTDGTFQIGPQVLLLVKNPHASTGDTRDAGLTPGWGKSPGGGRGDPLQCSCLEMPMDRGAWRAAVSGVSKSQTRLK